MPVYRAPLQDFTFIMDDLLNISEYAHLDGFKEVSSDLMSTILSEGGKFCEEVLFPINQSGDKEGCSWKDGNVSMPKGFKEAYQTYVESGWPSFSCDPSYGGQGLPDCVGLPFIEMICSANLAFGLTPGLTHGAYNALHTHASDALKKRFLPHMVTGNWSGVMCLTEPHAGTDLGLIRTKAEALPDGSYAITGNKIFISSGEHDMTDNIVHLVLAKLPDAPEGAKGISLFVVGKFNVDEQGNKKEKNNVSCGAIEHKMGIHGSSTCVMNYDNAIGYLVGEPHKGLRAMFTMMNEARLWVGIQGLGVAEAAYQNALHYAKERLQGRGLNGTQNPDKPADPLLVHPDVRRMLLTMKSFTEGARALAMWAAMKLDLKKHHPDPAVKEECDDFMQLMTPIIKAYFTDMGSEVSNLAMQIYGGHGYIKEYGIEQFVRDARITQIYEGANGIQALDLVGRKLPYHTGRYLRQFFHPAQAFIDEHRQDPNLAEFTKALYKALDSLQKASMFIGMKSLANKEEAGAASVEYLRMFALTVMGYMWCWMAKVSYDKLASKPSNEEFYKAKIATARFFMTRILPEHYGLLAKLTAGAEPIMGVEEAWF